MTPGPDQASRGARGRGRGRGGRGARGDASYSDNRGDQGQGAAAQSGRGAEPAELTPAKVAWKLFSADSKVRSWRQFLLWTSPD